jgi:IclR family transcriptional regulator, mhp operon transcriptional activator
MALSSPRSSEPVRRTFKVLEAMNRRHVSTLPMLEKATGIPKPTVARLLEGLIALGYVSQVSRNLGYRITDKVLSLATGVRFVDRLVSAAQPHMDRFTKDTGWPLYLGTISAGEVTISYSTAPSSPRAFESAAYDLKFPPLQSAIGLAYLAFCPEVERQGIIRMITQQGGVGSVPARHPKSLAIQLEDIRKAGYAGTRPPGARRIHGIATPIFLGEQVLGCLSIRFPRSAMNETQAAERFLPKLKQISTSASQTLREA